MRLIWKTLDGPGRNWRSIAKGLVLVDHLLRHGAERIVSDVQQHIHDIRGLTEFSYLEGHLDRGNGGALGNARSARPLLACDNGRNVVVV